MANFFSNLFKRKSPPTPVKKVRRFEAGTRHASLPQWLTTDATSFNREIEMDLTAVRARSRDASLNNVFIRRYLKSLVTNVVGPQGIAMQMKVRDPSGSLDSYANQLIETNFSKWSSNCTVDGMTWVQAQQMFIETAARDGEVLIQLMRGPRHGPYQFQLRFLEADYLAHNYNDNLSNGNIVRQGVEIDPLGMPVAYWMWTENPSGPERNTQERVRVLAADLIHAFVRERPNQRRGFPWSAAALVQLQHLDNYQESELIAARVSAAKMGLLTRPAGDDVDGVQDEIDPRTVIQEASPGTFDVLPEGWNVQMFDPTHPNSNYGDFVKVILRSTAASLGVSYLTLTGDTVGGAYGALRKAVIEETDHFKILQNFVVQQLCVPVFETFLEQALLTQQINLPSVKFDKFNSPDWRPSIAPWLDPRQEAVATQLQIEQGIRSRTDVCRSIGRDFNTVIEEIASEQTLMKKLGVVLPTIAQAELLVAQADAIEDGEPAQEAAND